MQQFLLHNGGQPAFVRSDSPTRHVAIQFFFRYSRYISFFPSTPFSSFGKLTTKHKESTTTIHPQRVPILLINFLGFLDCLRNPYAIFMGTLPIFRFDLLYYCQALFHNIWDPPGKSRLCVYLIVYGILSQFDWV